MNSAEEISRYHDHNGHYCSPVLARRTTVVSYDIPEKSPKKEKKWSLGNLFRRKKKGSESSSEEEIEQKQKKKRKERKKRTKTVGFDHVVLSPRNTISNGYKDDNIFSEPCSRSVYRNFIPASDFTKVTPSSPSTNSLGRRKKVVKVRAQARRDTSLGGDSSEEDSLTSPFISEESLAKKDASMSKRSRAARTHRYLKRRSRDDEISKSDLEQEHLKQHLRLAEERKKASSSVAKSYANNTSRNFSGLSTIPPSHIHNKKGSSQSFQEHNIFHAPVGNQRSLSCGSDIHSRLNEDVVVHAQFNLGRPHKQPKMIVNHSVRQPPPPPPRDPRRIGMVQSSDSRPISYSFENGYHKKNSIEQLNRPPATVENRKTSTEPSNKLPPSVLENRNFTNYRSTSEDHISVEPLQRVPLVPRPSSATPEANRLFKLAKVPLENGEGNYRYLADRHPRSRRPICIQPKEENRKSFDFWKKKDEEVKPASPMIFTAQTHVRTNIFLPNGTKVEVDPSTHLVENSNSYRNSYPSEQLEENKQTESSCRSALVNGQTSGSLQRECSPSVQKENSPSIQREYSPFRPITPHRASEDREIDVDEPDCAHRKSSNLEDALSELEAIYNSLHLGDEDLLERAEQREAAAAQKKRDAAFESFPDSSFGNDVELRKKRYRRLEPDCKTDDMAFRKLHRDRYHTINDPQAALSRVSYLLTSPVFNGDDCPTNKKDVSNGDELKCKKEPDVTLDDVVYRNVKHMKNSLKVADPQPPFGIPIGPVLPAANSDYLHAMPESTRRVTFKPKKIPDVVKDDLAYRNLRKDSNKEAALPQSHLSPEDYITNNNPNEVIKKKRAVRSLSANIFDIVHEDWSNPFNDYEDEDKTSITDVADALEIARQILKEKEEKITATRQAFMSDGEMKYRKYGQRAPADKKKFLSNVKANSADAEAVYHHRLQVNIPDSRLETKPPTPERSRRTPGRISKESTPLSNSPEEKQHNSTLDELLTSLATEGGVLNEFKDREESKSQLLKSKELLESGISPDPLARHFNDGIRSEEPAITPSGILEQLKRYVGHENESGNSTKQLKSYTTKEKPNQSNEIAEEYTRTAEERNASKGLLENGFKENSPEKLKKRSCDKLNELEKEATVLNTRLNENDANSHHAKLCEKLMECVVDDNELLAASKIETEPSEQVYKIDPLPTETLANVVLTPNDKTNFEHPSTVEVFSESDHDYVNVSTDDLDHDYVNINSEEETAKPEETSTTEVDEEERELLQLDDDAVSADICMSALERHKADLVAVFDELRLDDVINEGLTETHDRDGGEECVSVHCIALPTSGCALSVSPSDSMNVTENFTTFCNLNIGSVENSGQECYISTCSLDLQGEVEILQESPFSSNVQTQNFSSACNTDLSDNISQGNFDNSTGLFSNTSEQRDDVWIRNQLDSLESPKLVRNIERQKSVEGLDCQAVVDSACQVSSTLRGAKAHSVMLPLDLPNSRENISCNARTANKESQPQHKCNQDVDVLNVESCKNCTEPLETDLDISCNYSLDHQTKGEHSDTQTTKGESSELVVVSSKALPQTSSSTNNIDANCSEISIQSNVETKDVVVGLVCDFLSSPRNVIAARNLLSETDSAINNMYHLNTQLDHLEDTSHVPQTAYCRLNNGSFAEDSNVQSSSCRDSFFDSDNLSTNNLEFESLPELFNEDRYLGDCSLSNLLAKEATDENHRANAESRSNKSDSVESLTDTFQMPFSNSRSSLTSHLNGGIARNPADSLEVLDNLSHITKNSSVVTTETAQNDILENTSSTNPGRLNDKKPQSGNFTGDFSASSQSREPPDHKSNPKDGRSSESRERRTLNEPSGSWYEDPAAVALACSCGLACTSQLSPSLDVVAVLGLIFAVISVLIALLLRT